MRAAFALISALVIAAPAAALAQKAGTPGDNQSSSASETLNPSLAAGAPPIPAQTAGDLASTGQKANTAAQLPAVPSDWGGDAKSWAAHTKACSGRYKTAYDPATDQVMTKGGPAQKCMLAMGKAGR